MNPAYLKIGSELIGSALLDRVAVMQELNRHWTLEVQFRQTADERPPVERAQGQACQLFSYDQNGAEVTLFEGYVRRVELGYNVYGNYRGALHAVSYSHKMESARRVACYTTDSLAAIASEIAGFSGLTASVKTSAKRATKQYVQWAETDYGFLHRLCDDHSAWICPTPSGIEILDAFQASVPLTFSDEFGLLAFDASGRLGQPSMDGAHYDPRAMQSRMYTKIAQPPTFTGASGPLTSAVMRASQGNLPPGYLYDRSRAPALADYEARLKHESERALGSKVVGHGISRELRVRAGDRIALSGVIDAEGSYGLTKVIHRWTLRGYENEFWCTPWTKWLDAERPERRPWFGTVPARVVEHSDPENMGRVRIRYFWQEQGEPMLWARMMTPHSGQSRGFFFQPEVGDEVVVMFEDGDPERPVVLGALWNGVDASPTEDFWGSEYGPNDVKRIVTKSGNRIQIVDKPGKQAISLATPKNLKISLFENANETGRSMIELSNANGDILLSAPNGRIHVHGEYVSREAGGGGSVNGGARSQQASAALSQMSQAVAPPAGPSAANATKPVSTKSGCNKSPAQWQDEAEKRLASAGDDPLAHNKAITRAYADMYKSDPAAFKWAGMAAFASCEVGKGMETSRGYDWAPEVEDVSAKKLFSTLKAGNDAVYHDIYWQFLSYQSCGLSDLEKAGRENSLDPRVLAAWKKIDEGKQTGNQDEVWEGNTGLLRYEQELVLQKKVYDPNRPMWQEVTHFPFDLVGKVDSPIPGDAAGFEQFARQGDIGNFKDRWRWIKDSMLPAWKKLDQDPAKAEEAMTPCLR